MKKLFILAVALLATFGLTACDKTTTAAPTTAAPTTQAPVEHNYWATGAWANWGDAAGDSTKLMYNVEADDLRIATLATELADAEEILIYMVTLSADEAGWGETFTIDGTETFFDGNLTIKVIRTVATDTDNIPEWWAQSAESGEITNLTPGTLFLAPYMEDNVDGAGSWASNPFALEAGTYYLVFAQFDGSRAMGLIDVNPTAE